MSISPENTPSTVQNQQDASASAEPNRASSATAPRPSEQAVTYRVAPSMTGFTAAGLVLGLLVALLSTLLGPGSMQYTLGAVFGVLAVLFGSLGAACGALVALFLDKKSVKRAQTYRAIPED
ncbi:MULTISPECIES: hypothetical protein [unclassified Rothia (in: high G+C Gram-positive bacteria)]|uniref:hypothetical protein n=1 Tax=unclassified Rothia (in: high G+C Gram-positive bacteria) TaxID=2689056 RepID=UPI0019574D85|nr:MULTISPECIES: hypothetical protein [unclassified Rothia (in: high G+C Gram-positive bacteria)]MBM7052005.1 hypothetical protein [Rothia sp. ZJ1223]QRZ61934.1 hypothetical protein JR346_02030 [Rothia sp. ZJ932]